MAQGVSHWALTAEARVDPCGICGGQSGSGAGSFSQVLPFSPASIIPPFLHIHLSPPHEVCDSSDQAAHYHHLGPKLGALFLSQQFGWKQNKKVTKKIEHVNPSKQTLYCNTSGVSELLLFVSSNFFGVL
jgi:hypothetical protein